MSLLHITHFKVIARAFFLWPFNVVQHHVYPFPFLHTHTHTLQYDLLSFVADHSIIEKLGCKKLKVAILTVLMSRCILRINY